jgi:argonaute-like protein implicated in RNA metabolism and viral defense
MNFKRSNSSFQTDICNWRKKQQDICLFSDYDFYKRLKVLLKSWIELNPKRKTSDYSQANQEPGGYIGKTNYAFQKRSTKEY